MLEFRYRRFVFGPERVVVLPEGRHELARGVLMPVVVRVAGGRDEKSVILLPRYRGREEELSRHFGFAAVRDHAWARGWAAVKDWWRGMTARRIGQGS